MDEFKYQIGQSLVITGDTRVTGHDLLVDTVVDVIDRDGPEAGLPIYKVAPIGDNHTRWVSEADLEHRHLPGFGQPERPVESDPVHHPQHYMKHPSGVEIIDITRHHSFVIGNALKYIFRHEHKGQPVQDLKKAIAYLEFAIEDLEKEGK